jgi:uncharacterized protein (DUF58 family)
MPDAELLAILEKLAQVSIAARQAVESALHGPHRGLRRGMSVEFAGHRSYQPGDDLRHIDWPVLARADRYDIKVYDEETRLRATIVFDASGSAGYATSLQRLRDLGAALAVLLARQGDAVGLAEFHGATCDLLPATGGAGALGHVLDRLSKIEPSGTTSLGTAAETLAPRLPKRSLVILLSDCLDAPESLDRCLRILSHRHQDLRVVRVLHPHVVNFPLAGPVRCVGLEGERPRLLDADRVRPWYRETFSLHAKELTAACHRWGADLVTIQTDEPLGEALARLLTTWAAPTVRRRSIPR